MIKIEKGMKIKVKEKWNNFANGIHYVEDIVTILNIENEIVTFHSDYIGNIISVPLQNFWKGVELLELLEIAPIV